ncbi:MAG: NAD-dependent epimerase/dehydratase family protein, partial [Myxococcota bacterium]|nr:NAD-dependent epimerase/dehydratase family protein [Myxococcota bacterium]
VRAADLPGADLGWAEDLGVEVVSGSIDDPDYVDAAVAGTDIVLHTAGIFDLSASRELMERVNVRGTRIICEAAVRHDVGRFVHFSSVAVYGPPVATPCHEDGIKRPADDYQQTKWRAEQVVMEHHRAHGLPAVALRPALVYGPGSKYGTAMFLVSIHVMRFLGLVKFPLVAGGPVSNMVHIDDVVSATQLVARREGIEGRAFNVADDGSLSLEALSRMYLELCGVRPVPLPSWTEGLTVFALRKGTPRLSTWLTKINGRLDKHWPRMVEAFDLVPALRPRFDIEWLSYFYDSHYFDTGALKSLGWRPVNPSIALGMPGTLAWYREQRWMPTLEEIAAHRVANGRTP